eukprot:TRINITY_DN6705_c0_g1_i1.p1 TRINITY_DN6705_c0_g1~~TRINITY_DN6705_c0_g1_i1.p1  ORF type:complete len:837 (-),score=158.31 TRINITY_DN6705_c0_g1_i1:1066-3249(-)
MTIRRRKRIAEEDTVEELPGKYAQRLRKLSSPLTSIPISESPQQSPAKTTKKPKRKRKTTHKHKHHRLRSESDLDLDTDESDFDDTDFVESDESDEEVERSPTLPQKCRKIFSLKTMTKVLLFRLRNYPVVPLGAIAIAVAISIVVLAVWYDDSSHDIDNARSWLWVVFWAGLALQIIILENIFAFILYAMERQKVLFSVYYYTHKVKLPLVFLIWSIVNRFTWNEWLDVDDSDWIDKMFEVVILFSAIFVGAQILARLLTQKVENIDILTLTSQYLHEQAILKTLLNYNALQHSVVSVKDFRDGSPFRSKNVKIPGFPQLSGIQFEKKLKQTRANIKFNKFRLIKARKTIRRRLTTRPSIINFKDIRVVSFNSGFPEVLDTWLRVHKRYARQSTGKGRIFQVDSHSIPTSFSQVVSETVFANLDVDNKKYVDKKDFYNFWPDSKRDVAKSAFAIMNIHNKKYLLRRDMDEAMHEVLVRRAAIRNTLHDRENISEALYRTANLVALFLSLFFWPFIFGVSLETLITTLSFFLIGFSFVFGNLLRVALEGIIFIFVMRPFDVGDLVTVSGYPDLMSVARINILTTELFCGDGRGIVVPNNVMYRQGMTQYQRSKEFAVSVSFNVSIDDAMGKVWNLRDYLVDWMKHKSVELYNHDGLHFWISKLVSPGLMEVQIFCTLANINWADPGLWRREMADFNLAVIRGCQKFKIQYTNAVSPVKLLNETAQKP